MCCRIVYGGLGKKEVWFRFDQWYWKWLHILLGKSMLLLGKVCKPLDKFVFREQLQVKSFLLINLLTSLCASK